MKQSFDYFYGSQADQFSFVRIPRVMLTDKSFLDLSIPAKVLYGVLLDRMSLSRKNAWFDDQNRVFIIYQIGEIQEDLGFSKKKAMDLLSELEKYGLLEKKRRGHGLPNILYVKSFMSGLSASEEVGKGAVKSEFKETEDRGPTNGTSDNSRNISESTDSYGFQASNRLTDGDGISTGRESSSRSVDFDTSGQKTDESRSDGLGTLEVPESALFEVPKSEPLEVPILGPLKSYTETNKTERNHIESNHIKALVQQLKSGEMRSDTMRSEKSRSDLAVAYRSLICENIEYDNLLLTFPCRQELLEGIVDLILETVLCTSEEILIASNYFPTEIVKSRFLKLDYGHICYVVECLEANTTKVWNIKKYLLAALFNAPTTIDGYYTMRVNHDMPIVVSG